MSHLEEYYGEECPHCKKMQTLSKQLEKEYGIVIDRYEVWHNEENMKRIEALDAAGECGGVPYFINRNTGATVCGEASYEALKTWALD